MLFRECTSTSFSPDTQLFESNMQYVLWVYVQFMQISTRKNICEGFVGGENANTTENNIEFVNHVTCYHLKVCLITCATGLCI